jgi:methyl-accepting chemotaxis protein
MIYTTLQLFSLQDELILGVSTLSTDDISELSSVLNSIYITVALSLIIGLIAILLNFKTDQETIGHQLSFSNNNSKEKSAEKLSATADEEQSNLDMSSIHQAIKSNSDKKDKHAAVLTAICNKVEAGQGAIYMVKDSKEERSIQLYTSFAFHIAENEALSFAFGEGLIGQVAVEGNTLNIDDVPENYINIVSGLGSASPRHLLITPLLKNKKVIGIVELASFTAFNKKEEAWIEEGLNLLVNAPAKKTAAESATKKNKTENE